MQVSCHDTGIISWYRHHMWFESAEWSIHCCSASSHHYHCCSQEVKRHWVKTMRFLQEQTYAAALILLGKNQSHIFGPVGHRILFLLKIPKTPLYISQERADDVEHKSKYLWISAEIWDSHMQIRWSIMKPPSLMQHLFLLWGNRKTTASSKVYFIPKPTTHEMSCVGASFSTWFPWTWSSFALCCASLKLTACKTFCKQIHPRAVKP